MLNHGITSYGYRIEAPTTPGTINVEALKPLLEPGPKYQEVKIQDTFEHNGLIYQSDDFKGEAKPGPIIAIFGDTKPCDNEYVLAKMQMSWYTKLLLYRRKRHLPTIIITAT